MAPHPGKLDPHRCLGLLPEERAVSMPWRLQREGEAEIEIRPQGSLHFNTSDALVGAAAEGAGVALVLDIFARQALADGRLVQVYPDWQAGRKTFFAVTTRARLGAAKVRAFTDFLEEIMAAGQQAALGGSFGVRAFAAQTDPEVWLAEADAAMWVRKKGR
jgi:LysR family transcriptional regulator for bpeEF and oprC